MHLYKQDINHLDCELKEQQGQKLVDFSFLDILNSLLPTQRTVFIKSRQNVFSLMHFISYFVEFSVDIQMMSETIEHANNDEEHLCSMSLYRPFRKCAMWYCLPNFICLALENFRERG